MSPLFGHSGLELARDQLISVPLRLIGPQWMKRPKRASLHQSSRPRRSENRRRLFMGALRSGLCSRPPGGVNGTGPRVYTFAVNCCKQGQVMDERPAYNMRYIWGVTLVSAMGGLLFGYDWVVIGGAKPFYEKFFNLTTPSQIGWAMSSALIGCLVGALVSGGLSDRFGRKKLLILAAFLFTVTGILTALAPSFSIFITNRLLGGVAIGLASNLSPMYIAEISPASMRGRFVSVNQLTIVIGILAAQLTNWLIAEPVPAGATAADILASWNGQAGWRWMFGAEAVPAFLFFLLMFLVPESPRWLVKNGRAEEAGRVLARVGGTGFAGQALGEIRDTLATGEIRKVHFRSLLGPGLAKV